MVESDERKAEGVLKAEGIARADMSGYVFFRMGPQGHTGVTGQILYCSQTKGSRIAFPLAKILRHYDPENTNDDKNGFLTNCVVNASCGDTCRIQGSWHFYVVVRVYMYVFLDKTITYCTAIVRDPGKQQ